MSISSDSEADGRMVGLVGEGKLSFLTVGRTDVKGPIQLDGDTVSYGLEVSLINVGANVVLSGLIPGGGVGP